MSLGRRVVKGIAPAAAAALLVALLAACNGGGGDKPPSPEESPSATGTPDGGGGGGDGGGSEDIEGLEGSASDWAEGVTAKVAYHFSSGSGAGMIEADWLLVQRPPDSRFEMTSKAGTQISRTIIISFEDKMYLCVSSAGQESCLQTESDQGEAQSAPFEPLFAIPQAIADDVEGAGITDRSEREIAGLDATCYSVQGTPVGGEGEVCFSDDGLLLYLRTQSAGATTTYEATEVSTDVSDDDFEPPFPVTELPSR